VSATVDGSSMYMLPMPELMYSGVISTHPPPDPAAPTSISDGPLTSRARAQPGRSRPVRARRARSAREKKSPSLRTVTGL
jgi:hypothetical protein